MPDIFSPSQPPPPTVTDVRSPEEKNLANVRSNYFSGLYGAPDLGWQDQSAKLDPIYARYASQFKEGVAGAAAEAGFDPMRYGPGVSSTARGLQQMSENRAAQDIAGRQSWMGTVMSGGLSGIGASGAGRSVTQQQYGPSPFSSLLGMIL